MSVPACASSGSSASRSIVMPARLKRPAASRPARLSASVAGPRGSFSPFRPQHSTITACFTSALTSAEGAVDVGRDEHDRRRRLGALEVGLEEVGSRPHRRRRSGDASSPPLRLPLNHFSARVTTMTRRSPRNGSVRAEFTTTPGSVVSIAEKRSKANAWMSSGTAASNALAISSLSYSSSPTIR